MTEHPNEQDMANKAEREAAYSAEELASALECAVAFAIIADVRRQTDGNWPADESATGEVGLVDAHLDFRELARAAIRTQAVFDQPQGEAA